MEKFETELVKADILGSQTVHMRNPERENARWMMGKPSTLTPNP